VVGVNIFELDKEEELDVLQIDNTKVRDEQLASLKAIKDTRDETAVQSILARIEEAARTGNENILAVAVEAALARATLGEISLALEQVYGRYVATNNMVSGVYSKAIRMNEQFKIAREKSDTFAKQYGRRPRILVAKLGQDGHDRGAKVIATSFADIGFDVDIGPLFQTPQEVVKQALENDVHLLGISTLAGGHKALVPEVIALLKDNKREDILVIIGGVIPPQDYDTLFDSGVAAIFGPGSIISEAAIEILNLFLEESE